MDPNYQMEVLAYAEKTALAELEEAKAHERVLELKYEASRYNMEYFKFIMKQQQTQGQTGTVTPPPVV